MFLLLFLNEEMINMDSIYKIEIFCADGLSQLYKRIIYGVKSIFKVEDLHFTFTFDHMTKLTEYNPRPL